MSIETCDTCGTPVETDTDLGGIFEWFFGKLNYYCAACIKADRIERADDGQQGDAWEELQIKERGQDK
jgi:hypothetical protein